MVFLRPIRFVADDGFDVSNLFPSGNVLKTFLLLLFFTRRKAKCTKRRFNRSTSLKMKWIIGEREAGLAYGLREAGASPASVSRTQADQGFPLFVLRCRCGNIL